jgi:anthranilate/para-aminobenzoate synthase component II
VDHLHREVEILPVGIRLDILYKKFLASALRPAHLSQDVVLLSPGPETNSKSRPMKETLSSKHLSSMEHFLSDEVMSQVSYKRTLKSIH